MSKFFCAIVLLFFSFLLTNCSSINSQTVEAQNSDNLLPIKQPTPQKDSKIQVSSNGKAEFKGVSFSYNQQIFGEVKAEEVPEYPLQQVDFKGDGVASAHRYFVFDLSKAEYEKMYLAVYPVKDFPRMFAVSKDYEEDMKQKIRDLEKVLIDKKFRVDNEIPSLIYYDASTPFYEKVKHFSFPNGRGILFLTQYQIGFELVSNHNLTYVFEGITTDKKYYVLAEIPVSVDFLPNEQTDEFGGYKVPWGKLDDEREIKKFNEFNQKIGKRLDKLPSNKFKPDLKYFEEIIASLKIEQ